MSDFKVGEKVIYTDKCRNTMFHGVIGEVTGIYPDFLVIRSLVNNSDRVSPKFIRKITKLDKALK